MLPLSATVLHYAVRAVRHEMREAFRRDLPALEEMYLRDLMRTEDAREGLQAFLDKRPPTWKNR